MIVVWANKAQLKVTKNSFPPHGNVCCMSESIPMRTSWSHYLANLSKWCHGCGYHPITATFHMRIDHPRLWNTDVPNLVWCGYLAPLACFSSCSSRSIARVLFTYYWCHSYMPRITLVTAISLCILSRNVWHCHCVGEVRWLFRVKGKEKFGLVGRRHDGVWTKVQSEQKAAWTGSIATNSASNLQDKNSKTGM